MISGLWHGANWHYVIWGALHGIYLIFGQLTKNIQEKTIGLIKVQFLQKLIHAIITFSLAAFAWIFFRANSTSDAIYIVKNILKTSTHNIQEVFGMIGTQELWLIAISMIIMETVHWLQRDGNLSLKFDTKPRWQRWSVYYVLLFLILCFGVYNNTQFIYFQF